MSQSSTTSTFLVVNPASGSRSAADFASNVVTPLLHQYGLNDIERLDTTAQGDGVRVGKSIRHHVDSAGSHQDIKATTVILLGGDGTTHEVLNGFYQDVIDAPLTTEHAPSLQLVVIPTGTANALYSALYPPSSSSRHQSTPPTNTEDHQDEWRLKSLRAYLASLSSPTTTSSSSPSSSSTPRTFGLTLAVTATDDATDAFDTSKSESAPIIAHLVTSHALHASILLDSEKLRSTHPGVERFKIAAQENMTNWVDGRLTLQGHGDAPVQRYDPATGRFVSVDDELDLAGPIFYLVSATVDRFEPTFVPAPFAFPQDASSTSSTLARPLDALDVVLIRPLRDPLVKQHLDSGVPKSGWENDDTLPARQAFAQHRAGPITMGMYDEGSHVSLRYAVSSSSSSPDSVPAIGKDETGDTAVEYYRVGSWTWQPSLKSTRAPLTCIDGTLRRSPVRTSSRALPQLANKVAVWY